MTLLLACFFSAMIYGLQADNDRRGDAKDAKSQLTDALGQALGEQKVRATEHESLHSSIKNARKELSQKLDRIESILVKRQEELARQARHHVRCLVEESASSEEFRRSLHSAREWAREYNFLHGGDERPPRAQDGSRAVIDYYTGKLAAMNN